jgi:hypothetical protein
VSSPRISLRRGDPDDGLRKLFHDRVERCHWQALELGVVGAGVPDSNGCADGAEFWIEMKATDGWAVELNPMQVGWILRRMRSGGRVFIAVRRRHDGGPLLGDPTDELHIYEGWDAAVLKAEGMRSAAVPVLQTDGGPSRWDWGRVREVLTGWEFSQR